jgi:hypothetical protein
MAVRLPNAVHLTDSNAADAGNCYDETATIYNNFAWQQGMLPRRWMCSETLL